MNYLKPGMHIMADRGFKNIEPDVVSKRCVLHRPPSVKANEKSTKQEVRLSKQISSCRILIERVIGRIREYKMVSSHNNEDHSFIAYLDDIVIICCGLCNLQTKMFDLN